MVTLISQPKNLKNYFQFAAAIRSPFFIVKTARKHKKGKLESALSSCIMFTMQTSLREIIEEQLPVKSLIVVIVAIVLVAGYGLFTTTNTGTLVIDSPVYGAQVFVDEHPAGTLHEPPDSLHLSEAPGKHNIIVSKEGYWPWSESVEVKKHETVELHPFIVPQNIGLESMSRTVFSTESKDSDYARALVLFKEQTISDEIRPLVEATRIQGVTYADYAPGRTDVILLATKDGIYAVGVEKSDHPNFQPVYKSRNPSFAKAKDGTLYIKDDDTIFRAKGFGK